MDSQPDAVPDPPDGAPDRPDLIDASPNPEACNGADDDGDGVADEGLGLGAPCAVGQGACAAAGQVACVDGVAACVGDPGVPGAEACNDIDDDCDGVTDEALPSEPCYDGPRRTADVGACRTGQTACVGGAVVCADQRQPANERCDGQDADCDGDVDEGCASCGDGVMDAGEQCDDGNRLAGDGCAVNCEYEFTGGLVPGVQQNVPIASVTARGFWPCYGDAYAAAGEPLDDVLAACRGTHLLLGCRRVGARELQVAAEGEYEEVTRDVGGGRGAVNPHNGVDFYFSRSASWGFAPPGGGVDRNTCDVLRQGDPDRLCWHTANDAMRGGWRCGADVRLNESDAFERVVFTRTTVALGALRGFGHHGDCDSFNGCVDAATCAQAACEHEGRGDAVSWREGGCLDVPDLDCDMFAGGELDTAWNPGCNAPVAYDVVCAGGLPPGCGDGRVDPGETCDDGNRDSGDGCSPDCAEEVPLADFAGPRTDVSIAELTLGGFRLCHTETYGTVLDLAAIRGQCAGERWVVGCRPVGGGDALTVAAMGEVEAILDPVPNEAGAFREHNGARWYFGEDFSFGFAPAGHPVNRQPCDTGNSEPAQRLCWHTRQFGGWRCGATTNLNDSADWERVVLTR